MSEKLIRWLSVRLYVYIV